MADTQKSKGRRMFTLPVFAAVVLLMALALLLIPRGKKTGKLSPGDSLTIPLASVTQTASFYPVNVDGTEMENVPAETGFLGVWLSEGKHDVRFVYDCPGFRTGLYVSLAAAVVFVVLLVVVFLLLPLTHLTYFG